MHGFGASYYEHGCLILYDKDVLEADISENSTFCGIKRWWYNLFLISYTDKRALNLFKSSHAIRNERLRHFRNYNAAIHPLSKFSNFWERILLVVLLLNKFIFFHNAMDTFCKFHLVVYYMAVIFEVIIIFDIYISNKTGYIDSQTRLVVLDPKELPFRFCSTRLFTHSVAAIPLGTLLLVRYGSTVNCAPCKANYFVCTLSLLSPLSILRIVEATNIMTREFGSFWLTSTCRLLRIFIIGVVVITHIMSINETLTILGIMSTGTVDDSSFYNMMMAIKFKIEMTKSNYFFFAIEVSRICKMLFVDGYDLQPKRFYLDQIISVITYFVANTFLLWCFMEFYNILSRDNYFESQWILSKDRTINKLRCGHLSDIISYNVDSYFAFKMSRFKSVENMNCLYQALPALLREEIFLTCYSKFIYKIPEFMSWPENVVDKVVLLLKEEVTLAGDVVSNSGSQGEGLVIIFAGVMVVFSTSGQKLGHLIDGDYFGELSLVTDKEISMSTVLALTNCQLLILEKAVFRRFMKYQPKLFFELKKQLRDKFQRDGNNITGRYWHE